MQKELKSRQLYLFLIAFLPFSKLFTMPSILAKHANEDMWLCAVLGFLLDFITLFFIVKIMKKTDKDLFTILNEKLGKTATNIVLVLFLIYFTLKAILPINENKDYVEMTLYTLMPTMLYFLPFFIICFYFCVKPLRVLGRAADVLWITSLIGIVILFSLSFSNSDFSAILPIGANGVGKIVKGWLSTLTWFGDSVYFLFFIGEFNYQKSDDKKFFLCYFLSALMVVFFLIMFYSVFTSIASRQRFALTEISKYTTVINNIGRFDYLGIFLLLFSGIFSLSLPVYFSCRIINRLFNLKKTWIAPLITVSVQLFIMIFLQGYSYSIESIITKHLGVFFLVIGNLLPIIISLFAVKEKKYAA
ncbi:MAG: GerAB/ArcD/ProY family transporter [Clostridia bacterium]|nr:GerAB/ArcD/ProY family transporter [Clostridia bacterium]